MKINNSIKCFIVGKVFRTRSNNDSSKLFFKNLFFGINTDKGSAQSPTSSYISLALALIVKVP